MPRLMSESEMQYPKSTKRTLRSIQNMTTAAALFSLPNNIDCGAIKAIANNTINQMSGAEIEIGTLNGNISLPYANSSNVHILEMTQDSQAYIHSTSGDVAIDALRGKAWIETTSGDVNIHSYNDDLEVKTASGDINVIYEADAINDELYFYSSSGSIDVRVKSNLAFILRIYGNDNAYRNDSKIDFQLQGESFANPLTINNGTKYLTINTDGNVYIGLINLI